MPHQSTNRIYIINLQNAQTVDGTYVRQRQSFTAGQQAHVCCSGW